MFNKELLLLCQLRDINSKSRRNALNLEQCTVNYREDMQPIIKKIYLISYGKKIKIKCNIIKRLFIIIMRIILQNLCMQVRARHIMQGMEGGRGIVVGQKFLK